MKNKINLYLDDIRECPSGFAIARTVEEAIYYLENFQVLILSLDHDLGMDKSGNLLPSGYDLVKCICEKGLRADQIYIHTDNVVGRENMFQTLLAAQRRGFIDKDIQIYNYPYVQNKYVEDNEVESLSIPELAKYFGVSISTINLWINEGRFIGFEKSEKYEKCRVKENALWKNSNGEFISVKEVVAMWYRQYNKDNKLTQDEEIDILVEELTFFEKKYGGNYENTLMLKKDKTNSEEKDSAEWRFIMRKLKLRCNEIE